nr:LAGLIDADG family homing endonuclease [Ferrimicrobium acidiphilum]
MGELHIGDVVFDERGQPVSVTDVTEVQFGHECYKVVFDDGSCIVADADHLWVSETQAFRSATNSRKINERKRGGRPLRYQNHWPNIARLTHPALLTTKQMSQDIVKYRHLNHAIRNCAPLELPTSTLPIDPYTFGVWLGDGTSIRAEVTTMSPEILQMIESNGHTISVVKTPEEQGSKAGLYSIDHGVWGDAGPFQTALRRIKVLGNKHIPQEYLRSSVGQRLDLLAGLMDTDGYISREKNSCVFYNTNKKLADGVAELVISLGWKAWCREKEAKIDGVTKGKCYVVTFRPDRQVFRYPRKAERLNLDVSQSSRATRRFVTMIERVESVPVKCIVVDSPSHLYLAGSQMVPTHNSYAIRKIVEEAHPHVQIILIDIEGEFATLREKYDFLLIGEEGELKTSTKTAQVLAKKLLELNVSAIIDLYELPQQERKHYVRLFLDAMVNAPKNLWHPCLVIVDEAHVFCPQVGESEAMPAVNDLMTRGRKRGYCGILATQRLSKLHKDSAAEAGNKLIGRCGLDDDMKRGAYELGFTTRSETLSLRDLDPGEFYAFGPALSKSVTKVKVGQVKTTHPKSGTRVGSQVTPPTPKIKSMISKLEDIPQVAERELKDRESMLSEIRNLRAEVTRLKVGQGRAQPAIDEAKVRDIEARAFDKGTKTAYGQWEKYAQSMARTVSQLQKVLSAVGRDAAEAAAVSMPETPHQLRIGLDAPEQRAQRDILRPHTPPVPQVVPIQLAAAPAPQAGSQADGEKPLREGAMKMLRAAAQFYPKPISREQMATLSGFSVGGGTFNTYRGELLRAGWIEDNNGIVTITDSGLSAAGTVDPLPTDPDLLVNMWAGKFREGAAKMLKYVCSRYPEWVSDEEIGQNTGFTHTGGTYNTYRGELVRNKLIEKKDGMCRASPTLFLE